MDDCGNLEFKNSFYPLFICQLFNFYILFSFIILAKVRKIVIGRKKNNISDVKIHFCDLRNDLNEHIFKSYFKKMLTCLFLII